MERDEVRRWEKVKEKILPKCPDPNQETRTERSTGYIGGSDQV